MPNQIFLPPRRAVVWALAVLLTIGLGPVPAAAQERERAAIPDQFKWNLADIYPSEAAWRAAKDALAKNVTQLEGIKGTVFRQTQFAEFELRMHEMLQAGKPLTGDALAQLYMEITKKDYGHDQKVCIVDDDIKHEWSYIPHFYRDFYAFQYATSFTASEALAQKVKAGDATAVRRYLTFLSSGGSKYPIDLLKDAGVDMTTDEPLDLTLKEMNRVMDEMETILANRR